MKVIAFALALLATNGIQQTTWYVDGTNCTGAGDGSWSDPFCTIQEGVDRAQDGDRIEVRAGEYVETVLVDGRSLAMHGSDGFEQTILRSASEGTDPDFPALKISSGASLELRSLTIKGSRPGILVEVSEVSLKNCLLDENQGDGSSNGAEGIAASLSRVTLQQCALISTGNNCGETAISGMDSVVHVYGSSVSESMDALGYSGTAVTLRGGTF
jgi:pectin methylesterase-like acyl-CoA thioesterase